MTLELSSLKQSSLPPGFCGSGTRASLRWVLHLRASPRPQSGCWLGCSHLEARLGRLRFPLTRSSPGLSSSQAADGRPASVPLVRASPRGSLPPQSVRTKEARKPDSRTEVVVFCDLIVEMALVILAAFCALKASHTWIPSSLKEYQPVGVDGGGSP